MDEKTIKERIAGYRNSREEWLNRRRIALEQASEQLARANACDGAIEALEDLLPAVPVEDIAQAIGGKIDDETGGDCGRQ